ncbi:unnamed protein product [Pylaiella littoralis]
MRMVNAPYKPKEETLKDMPGPQDVFGMGMSSRIKEIEADFATTTVPVTSSKQFDRPVERIATGNGSAGGFHIGAGKRHHKFILNEQPPIESRGGPRGAFAGASGSRVKGDYETVTQRSSLQHESIGPPVAAGVPQSSAPHPSFEISPSHLETYSLDKQNLSKSARANVQRPAGPENRRFAPAHDENIQVLHTSLVTGGERFATGASGNREVRIHVPLNNDPLVTFDERVVPNFKISKASDFKGQQTVARQMMIPEMSQNVSALRKDTRPPIPATTDDTRGRFSLQTDKVTSGSAVRGANSLPIHVPVDAFRAAADRKGAVAEKTALASRGAAASHLVHGSNSASTSSSLVRTTNKLAEGVGMPFIRGAGSKRKTNLPSGHEATDTHLSELEVGGLLGGVNKFSKLKKKPADASSGETIHSETRSVVFKKSERPPLLAAPTPRESSRADKLSTLSTLKEEGVVRREVRTNPVRRKNGGTYANDAPGSAQTSARKLGDVLNGRIGSSPALKKMLSNPYSLPAASRIRVSAS